MTNNEIVIYKLDEVTTKLEVKLEDETVWLTQTQMVELFNSSKQNISLHINNVFKEGELNKKSTVKEYLTVQIEGNREIKRKVFLYNLDIIISVGYRVKSKRGTQFRIWANQIIKEYLLKGYTINKRVDRLEEKLIEHDKKFDILLNTNLHPNEGIFYDGQIFDAYKFVNDIIKSANSSIVLIDNYIDDTVLSMLTKRAKNVKVIIYTSNFTKQLKLDVKKYNQQYDEIEVNTFKKAHDRFLIIDDKTVYHIGASLKDLGKKWFAFSKINLDVDYFLGKLK